MCDYLLLQVTSTCEIPRSEKIYSEFSTFWDYNTQKSSQVEAYTYVANLAQNKISTWNVI